MTTGGRGPGCPISELNLAPVLRVAADDSIAEVARRMWRQETGAVVVDDHLSAIVTEHDIVRAVAEGIDPVEPVSRIAVETPLLLEHSATVADAAALMVIERVRHLVAVDGTGQAVGVVTVGRVLQALADGVDPVGWAVMEWTRQTG